MHYVWPVHYVHRLKKVPPLYMVRQLGYPIRYAGAFSRESIGIFTQLFFQKIPELKRKEEQS